MPRVGFEPKISAGERPKTYALDCAATGIGAQYFNPNKNFCLVFNVHSYNTEVYRERGILYSAVHEFIL